MIYRVVLDDLYDLHTSDINCMLLNPSLELEMNSAGSFNFTLPPKHPSWDRIEILKSTIDVYEDDDLIFTGRVANIDKNWNNERVVECEGALAYFNDSIHRQNKWENPIPIAVDPDDQPEDPAQHQQNFLEDILNNHNAFVGNATNRQIHMGHIYVDPFLVTREVDYDKTLDILNRMCIDTNGGYFMIRKDPETHLLYLDWLKDFTEESGQPASFGVNLLDFNTGLHAEDICTGVLARGATVNDQVVTLTNVELVDKDTYPDMSVDHYTDRYQDILWHREGVSKFGQVVQVHDFPDAQTDWKNNGQVVANSLFEEARKWLEEKNTKIESIEVEVAELSWLREGVPKYKLGQIVEILDDAHMAGEPYEVRRLPMYKLSCDLSSGSKKVTLGRPPKKELTQISASNSDSSTLSSGNSSGSSSGGGSGEECKVHDVRVDGTSVVSNKIANISLVGKADVNTVNALAATVANKADTSTVTALATTVAGKQDQIDFNTQEAATEVLTRLKADNVVYNLGGGTEVIANPSESATDDLETIKIGDTVYDIPGGGSSTNYGKFKCDVLFNTPTTTSAWASPIEICSEEKAKEYDMIYLITKFVDETSNGFISNSYLVNSIGQTSDSNWMMGIRSNSRWNNTEGFIFLSFDDSKLKFYTNTGNSSTLYKVYGLKFENKLINRSDIYSEEERMIGRWTDGKPLYQKTYDLGIDTGFPNNTWTTIISDVTIPIDKVIKCVGVQDDQTAVSFDIWFDSSSDSLKARSLRDGNETIRYFALQYTKTTDTPDSGVIPEDPMFISDPMIYSEEEQVVGSWTDGKPIYQKTMSYDFTSSVNDWTLFDDSVSYEKMVAVIPIMSSINSSEDQIMQYGDSETTPRWCIKNDHKMYYYLNNARRKGVVTFQYTKTTDSVLSGPKKGKIVQRSDIYSEEERLIGRWTDGKPLYQKTYKNLGINLSASTWTPTGITFSDIDYYKVISNKSYLSDSQSQYPMLYRYYQGTFQAFCQWQMPLDELTLQYTKTTDAPFSKQLIEDPQFVMMSDIYSEDEQVVGRWTDGKPIYQKVIRGNFNGAYSTTISMPYDDISYNIEYIIRQESYAKYRYGNVTSSDAWFKADHAVNNNINFRVEIVEGTRTFALVLDNPSWATMYDYYVIIQYTKTTDAPGTGPTKGNLIYLPALYSEEEREVGVWTDGKPLYQKTFKINVSSTSGTYAHNLNNIDNIFINNSATFFVNSNGSIENYYSGGYGGSGEYISGYNKIIQAVDNAAITIKAQPNVIANLIAVVTLQYTKTTDQPGSGTWTPEGQLAHHYSTSEKIVGTWIDGSTVYERTWDLGSDITVSASSWYTTNILTNEMNRIINYSGFDNGGAFRSLDVACDDTYLQLLAMRNSGSDVVRYITLQYTKSS